MITVNADNVSYGIIWVKKYFAYSTKANAAREKMLSVAIVTGHCRKLIISNPKQYKLKVMISF